MSINRFIVFDVETPNRYNNRMSAIGISVVEDGRIVDEYFSLVDPEQPFDWFNAQFTGMNEETVFDAPAFPEVWEQIEPLMSSGILVAHNASFDMGVLRRCLESCEIEWKPYAKAICTVIMGRSFYMSDSKTFCILCKKIFLLLIIYITKHTFICSSPDFSVWSFCHTVYGNTESVHCKFTEGHFTNAVSVCGKPYVSFAVLNDSVDV